MPGRVTGARVWLFRLPSGQIVAALSLDVNCELIDTIDLLEDCYFGDVADRRGNPRGVRARPGRPARRRSAAASQLPARTPPDRLRPEPRRPRTARTWSSG